MPVVKGIEIGRHSRGTKVLAYADDVKIFFTIPTEFDKVIHAILIFEIATGAKLNPKKSKALAVRNWRTPATELGIRFREQVKILGVTFGKTIAESCNNSWTVTIQAVRAQARIEYQRSLTLSQSVLCVHMHLFAMLWYIAQFLPTLKRHIQQLNTVYAWYIWKGAIFRVPISTLTRPKHNGGWALQDIEIKCRNLTVTSVVDTQQAPRVTHGGMDASSFRSKEDKKGRFLERACVMRY
jgi:hypothetical protein